MLPLILQAGGEASLDIVSLILNASPVVKGVLGLLILMSVASWFVIGSKFLYLANASSRSTKFQDNFWKTGRLDDVSALAGYVHGPEHTYAMAVLVNSKAAERGPGEEIEEAVVRWIQSRP